MPSSIHFGAILLSVAFLSSSTTTLAIVDANDNGMSDVWEAVFSARNIDPLADSDGDGSSNRDESVAGTNPFDAASVLRLQIDPLNGGSFTISCPLPNAKKYDVFHTEDLANPDWQPIASIVTDDPFTYTDHVDASRGFYRVRVSDFDQDDNNLSDWEEARTIVDTQSGILRVLSTGESVIPEGSAGNPSTVYKIATLSRVTNKAWPVPATVRISREGDDLGQKNVFLGFSEPAYGSPDFDLTWKTSGMSAVNYGGSNYRITFPQNVRDVYFEITAKSGTGGSDILLNIEAYGGGLTYEAPDRVGVYILNDDGSFLENLDGNMASRFLSQATFGATRGEIDHVKQIGIPTWIDEQIALPPTLHKTYTDELLRPYTYDSNGNLLPQSNIAARETTYFYICKRTTHTAFFDAAVHGDDQLRQRVAWALAQIFVISFNDGSLQPYHEGRAIFHDIFVRNAFGNFRDIIDEVSYNPMMAQYLTYMRSRKADPATGSAPDENYARELMQLFTIGLWELNPDGSRILDENDDPIPTYDNDDITELSRVFTGMTWGGPLVPAWHSANLNRYTVEDGSSAPGDNYYFFENYAPGFVIQPEQNPMVFFDGTKQTNGTYRGYLKSGTRIHYYDHAAKTLFNQGFRPGHPVSIPKNIGAEASLDIALDALFNHPNTGPFICRQLIQRLVKSNPSPTYIQDIAGVFADNGSSERGDLGAAITAILTHPEARSFSDFSNPEGGKLREPYIRLTNLARLLSFDSTDPEGLTLFTAVGGSLGQEPGNSPSVFNFYSPDY
ncbi:DUF1800 family protein, partial [Haloferula sp.]|uniref:DUF1800 family protein n=1 Tax=Haloferula sp. TaxID=2497595 RepID=UPI003C72DB99